VPCVHRPRAGQPAAGRLRGVARVGVPEERIDECEAVALLRRVALVLLRVARADVVLLRSGAVVS
jgi:hypothetical protein